MDPKLRKDGSDVSDTISANPSCVVGEDRGPRGSIEFARGAILKLQLNQLRVRHLVPRQNAEKIAGAQHLQKSSVPWFLQLNHQAICDESLAGNPNRDETELVGNRPLAQRTKRMNH